MPAVIPLQIAPNQSFSIRLDGARYDIAMKAAGTIMAVTIARDGAALVTGARVVAGTPLLPYAYQEAGNFLFLTDAGAAPWWELFGTQSLIYLSAAELASAQSAAAATTAEDDEADTTTIMLTEDFVPMLTEAGLYMLTE